MDWQLIETAPKDETAVLLFSEEFGIRIGRYGPLLVQAWRQQDFETQKLVSEDRGGIWLCDSPRGGTVGGYYSHWMPLPEAPLAIAETMPVEPNDAGLLDKKAILGQDTLTDAIDMMPGLSAFADELNRPECSPLTKEKAEQEIFGVLRSHSGCGEPILTCGKNVKIIETIFNQDGTVSVKLEKVIITRGF